MRSRRTWWLWARFEAWLEGLAGTSSPVLFGGFLAWFLGWSLLVGFVVDQLASASQQDDLTVAARGMMPAVGTLFALLTAFVITNQWNRSRDAERVVGAEAGASLRLAWASGSPGVDGPALRRLHLDYLQSVVDDEWDTLRHDECGSETTGELVGRLERTVRSHAGLPTLPTAVAADLLDSSEGVAVSRRDRLNLAGHGLPAPLFLLAFVSGVVLCLNAIALSVDLGDWVALVIGGLIVTIALDLALVVAISDPFRGPLKVLPAPITAVLRDLESGRFGPVAPEPAPPGQD